MNQNSIFSFKTLLSKFLTINFLLLCVFLTAQSAPPPVEGDYRSRANGDWTAAATWEVYSCSGGVCAWVPAVNAPGEGTTVSNQATYSVFITAGTEINVTRSQTYYFGNLFILANNPIPNVYSTVSSGADVGRINLLNESIEFKLLGDQQNVYILGGVFYFVAYNSTLGLRNGNSIIITDYNGLNSENGLGSNGIQQLGIRCTSTQTIKFYNADGTAVISEYGSCLDASSQYTFLRLNNFGGSLAAQLALAPNKICVGDATTPVILSPSYTGIIPANKNVTYELKLESGPAGYSFTPITGTFKAPGSTNNIPSPSLEPFAIAGDYVYSLTLSYPIDSSSTSYHVTSKTTAELKVSPVGSVNCACYKDSVTDNANKYPTKFGITAVGRAGAGSSTNADFWPESAQGGHLALESQLKGFVINRVENTGAILIPVEGMMVFDLSDGQPKIFTLKDGDSAAAWHTFTTPTCPTF